MPPGESLLIDLEDPLAPSAPATEGAIADAASEQRAVAGANRWRELLAGRSTFSKGVLSLADQAVVSAVNFLTMVLIGRAAAHQEIASNAGHELGLYQLGFSIMMLAICVQNALISTPYAVFGNRMNAAARMRYAGSTLIHQWLLSAVMAVVLIVAGGVMMLGIGPENLGTIAWVLAAALPFILLREFVRRVGFAHLRVFSVLALDVAAAALQICGLVLLKASGHLSAATGIGMIGVSCAIAGGVTIFLMRSQFSARRKSALSHLQLSWSFGKWSFAAQLTYLAMMFCIPWLLTFLASTDATGRFAACNSLVMIANPVLIGVNNFLQPRAIHAFAAEGSSGLWALTWRSTLATTAVVTALALTLIFAGGWIVSMVYGTSLIADPSVVAVLALLMLLNAQSMGAENGLIAMGRPAAVLWSNVMGLIVIVVAGYFLILHAGLMGAAIATLIGQFAAMSAKCVSFFFVFRVQRELQAQL